MSFFIIQTSFSKQNLCLMRLTGIKTPVFGYLTTPCCPCQYASKENCINIIQHNFGDPVASEKDFEGFNLYLQLQQINIIPKTNLILSFIRALSYIANSIVTIASLYTLLVQAF